MIDDTERQSTIVHLDNTTNKKSQNIYSMYPVNTTISPNMKNKNS